MADVSFENPETFEEILQQSSRLRYLITQVHMLTIDDISSVRIDGDNMKIDFNTNDDRLIRYKAKGTDHVVATNTEGNMEMVLDPALAQAIYALVDEYAQD